MNQRKDDGMNHDDDRDGFEITQRIIAIHELGHLIGALASGIKPYPHRVSIIPDPEAGTGGRVWWRAFENASPHTEAYAEPVAAMLLAGMAAVERAHADAGTAATIDQHGAGGDVDLVVAVLDKFKIPVPRRERLIFRANARARACVHRYRIVISTVAPILEEMREFGPAEIAMIGTMMEHVDRAERAAVQTFVEALKSMVTRQDVERARSGKKPLSPPSLSDLLAEKLRTAESLASKRFH
jgi:hypothetical protein